MEPNNNKAPEGTASPNQPNNNSAPEEAHISSQPNNTTPNQPTKSSADTGDIILGHPKSQKPLTWCLGILALISLVAAAVFAYLYFSAPQNTSSTSSSPKSGLSEEIEIKDTYILRDLDEKMSILHDTRETGALMKKGGFEYLEAISLYQNRLSEIAKIAGIANSIIPDYPFGSNEIQSIASEQGYNKENTEAYLNTYREGYKAETLAKKYLDVFGKELVKGAANGQSYCPEFYYNSTYDFYYNASLGCGGTGPDVGLFYKNKYTSDGEHAYVYVSVGTFSAEDNNIYCGIIDYSDSATSSSERPAICGSATDSVEAKIDKTNYQDFSQYRFVFNKADDGTYYFSKVEKL